VSALRSFFDLLRANLASLVRPRRSLSMVRTLEAVMEAHRRGDYAAELERAEGFRAGTEITEQYCFFRGAALANLGRDEEAERWLRRHVTMRMLQKEKALGWAVLGDLLVRQRRFHEAMECFQTCLQLWPERPSSRRNIAEWHLRCGDDAGEAVRWAREAVERQRSGRPRSDGARRVHRLNLGEALATLAWAVSVVSGDRKEVDRLIVEAEKLVNCGSVQSAAQVHCQAGHAYTALGDVENGMWHFEEAARIDRQGRWGREARGMTFSMIEGPSSDNRRG